MNPSMPNTTEIDPAEGFSDRLDKFQRELGFTNNEAADFAGISYNAYTRWKNSDKKLPSRPLDIQKLVMGASSKYGTDDMKKGIKDILAWLCFGLEDLNPFDRQERLDKSTLADYCLQHLKIYDDILADPGVDKAKVTEKKKMLALKKILNSSVCDNSALYRISEEDAEFVKDILCL